MSPSGERVTSVIKRFVQQSPAGAPMLMAGLAMLGFGAKRNRKTKV